MKNYKNKRSSHEETKFWSLNYTVTDYEKILGKGNFAYYENLDDENDE